MSDRAPSVFDALVHSGRQLDETTLRRDDLRACGNKLTGLAGNGYSEMERAAFVVLRDDGRFDCNVWPNSFAWHRETFSGLIPQGTVAVIHTHPRNLPRPSPRDFDEAKRLDIPVIAVTSRSFAMARPSDSGERASRPLSVRIRHASRALKDSDEATSEGAVDSSKRPTVGLAKCSRYSWINSRESFFDVYRQR